MTDIRGNSRASQKRNKKKKSKLNPRVCTKRPKTGIERISSDEDDSKIPSIDDTHSRYDCHIAKHQYLVDKLKEILILEDISQILCDDKASLLFANIVHPSTISSFYEQNWGKHYLIVHRQSDSYFRHLFCFEEMNKMMLQFALYFSSDVLVSKYQNNCSFSYPIVSADVEQPTQLANSEDVIRRYDEGYTVRILCPQKYNENLWFYLAALESHFDSAIHCNVLHSPPNSQEVAACDDHRHIFVLQIEGSTRWQLSDDVTCLQAPFDSDPCRSSSDKEVVEEIMEAGDSIYLPPGKYYRWKSTPSSNSLAIHLYLHRINAPIDLIETILPVALQGVAEESPSLRRSLPKDFISFSGVAHSEKDFSDQRRAALTSSIREHLMTLVDHAIDKIDAAADQVLASFGTLKHSKYMTYSYLLAGEEIHHGEIARPDDKERRRTQQCWGLKP